MEEDAELVVAHEARHKQMYFIWKCQRASETFYSRRWGDELANPCQAQPSTSLAEPNRGSSFE